MHRLLRTLVIHALTWALAVTSASAEGEPRPGDVVLLQVQGGIGPATTDYLARGIRNATRDEASAVVIRLDTPGGLDAATRDINQEILSSPLPVIVWVAPGGARAASAGTYILYASHVAAMAPATSLGAATPVAIGGPGGRGDDEGAERETAMAKKAINDAVSYLRGIAELRGRDAEFAEQAIREARTLTASQALEAGVIEIIAANLDDLLAQAHGREVKIGERGETMTLATADRAVREVEPDWRSKFLSVITDPSMAYILLLIGLYGLVLEGYNPGAIVPGVVGAISLLMALYALQVLPVNYVGVALIVLGVALIAVETFVPSFGALGIGGVVALVAGSVMLFDADVPGFGVPGTLIIGIGAVSAVAFLGVLYLAVRARRRPVTTGVQELLGEVAVVVDDFEGVGRVHVRGETWQAYSDAPLRRGEEVRVLAVEGLSLRVAPRGDATDRQKE
jgi:membrane-bound serine protease (ClpP class)